MKLQLNKLMAGLVMAGTVAGLVACGGGDEPQLQTKISSTVKATDTTAIATAVSLTKALDEVALPLTTAAADALKVPGATEIKFTGPAPAGTTGGIATATIKADSKTLETTVKAGSCQFVVTGPQDAALRITKPGTNPAAPYAINDVIVVEPCAFSTDSLTGLSATPQTRTVTITIGTATVTSTAQATVVNGVVNFNNVPVATQSATGAITPI